MTASTPNPDGEWVCRKGRWAEPCTAENPHPLAHVFGCGPAAPPAPSSGSPAPTCADCDGTGWYDGDNRCPNGCPIPARSGSPAADEPIVMNPDDNDSFEDLPAPLSPVPEDGPDFDLPRALRGWAKHVRLDEFRTAAEVMELAAVHIEQAEQQEQAVLACINIYGDEVLHSALDAIGYLTRPAAADREGEQP